MAQGRRNLILLACALLSGQLFAADAEPIKFRLLSISNSISVLYDEDGETRRIYTSPGYFSDWLIAPPSREVTLYQEAPAPDGQGAKLKKILDQTKLPSGPGPFLIMVHQQPGTGKLLTSTLNHSLDTFPKGQYRLVNLSKRRMAVNLADKNMLLEPGTTEMASYPNGRKTWLKVAVNDKDSGWMKVVSKPRPVQDTTRTSIVIMDIPPSDADPDPIGIIVREAREQIYETPEGVVTIQ